ncbi:MAG: hypothetical protein WA687_10605, partial [Solirubrobacterales bacterium]
ANRLVVAVERAPGPSPDELEWRPAVEGQPRELGADLWEAVKDHTPNPAPGNELSWLVEGLAVPNPEGDSLRLTVRELEYRPGEGDVQAGAFRIAYADEVRLA